MRFAAILAAAAMVLGGCSAAQEGGKSSSDSAQQSTAETKTSRTDPGLNTEVKAATQYTIDANEQVYALLDFDDKSELENAKRGLIVSPAELEIKTNTGKVAWSQKAYAFLKKRKGYWIPPDSQPFGEMRSSIIYTVCLRLWTASIRSGAMICQISHS